MKTHKLYPCQKRKEKEKTPVALLHHHTQKKHTHTDQRRKLKQSRAQHNVMGTHFRSCVPASMYFTEKGGAIQISMGTREGQKEVVITQKNTDDREKKYK